MKKTLFIVLDGLGDEPVAELGGLTPLEAAKTKNMDRMAQEGIVGLAQPQYRGATPTSEECHFSMFGYDPREYKIRRGIITATGVGIEVQDGDVALRGNLATIDDEMNMVDRRAGRVKDPTPFIGALQGIEIDGVQFMVQSATEHRLAIVMRGEGLDPDVSDGDPHYGKLGTRAREVSALEEEAQFTAEVLNKFLKKTHEILKNHPGNEERRKRGLPEVNYVLTRGASFLPKLPSFQSKYGMSAACIAGKFLYKQIGSLLGMEVVNVKGANGKSNTNIKRKVRVAKKLLNSNDFVFLHIKAADSLAEDGKFLEKKEFIERVDGELGSLRRLKDTLVVITCDHSTSSVKKRHSELPCPVLVWGGERDDVKAFSEKECEDGELGRFNQIELMSRVVLPSLGRYNKG